MAGEFGLVTVERSHVERLAVEGDRRSRRILGSLRNLSFELSGAQLGITVTSLVLGAIAEPAVADLIAPLLERLPFGTEESSAAAALVIALSLATGASMVFGELLPKNYALARPFQAAARFGIPMQMVNRALRSLILFLNGAANWSVRLLGIEPREELAGVRSMEELGLMIRSSGEAGWLAGNEIELLTRAISFTEKVAADVMVPRAWVIALRGTDSISDLRRLSRETGHSRFPVYGDDLDDIRGIVHVKDSLAVPAAGRDDTPVVAISHPAPVVGATAPVGQLLADLQRQGRGMAVVVDEHGGTAGIVAVEDLLEEIMGEIADEHDAAETVPPARDEPGLSGLLRREEVRRLTGFEWPKGRYRTLGGFLVAVLGRFPVPGEVIRTGGWAFEVVAMAGRRVERVMVRERPVASGEGEA